jgi:glycerophosphoryl diester phosphodiesterase
LNENPVGSGGGAGERRAPLVIAHRGFAAGFPENTLLAFRSALLAAADGLECDVRLSADGVPVVIHDATVDRTTDGTGAVAELSWQELTALDAGSWLGAGFAGERLPRLEDLLELVAGTQPTPRLFVEIKDAEAEQPGITETVATAIRDAGLASSCALGSFRLDVLRTAIDLAPDLELHHIVGGPPVRWPDLADGLSAVNPEATHLDRATCDGLRGRGLAVHPWTVDDPADMARLRDWGVDGLITDDPATARAVLDAG